MLSNAALACLTWRHTSDDPTPLLQVRALLCDREGRLGHTSTEEIKAHPFFAGVDWPSLRTQRAPYATGRVSDMAPHIHHSVIAHCAPLSRYCRYKPRVSSITDTSNFDSFDERPADGGGGSPPGPASREHGLAFVGYQYRRYRSSSAEIVGRASLGTPPPPGSGACGPLSSGLTLG